MSYLGEEPHVVSRAENRSDPLSLVTRLSSLGVPHAALSARTPTLDSERPRSPRAEISGVPSATSIGNP